MRSPSARPTSSARARTSPSSPSVRCSNRALQGRRRTQGEVRHGGRDHRRAHARAVRLRHRDRVREEDRPHRHRHRRLRARLLRLRGRPSDHRDGASTSWMPRRSWWLPRTDHPGARAGRGPSSRSRPGSSTPSTPRSCLSRAMCAPPTRPWGNKLKNERKGVLSKTTRIRGRASCPPPFAVSGGMNHALLRKMSSPHGE